MYGCDSWNGKKAECWRIDAFELWCWRRLLIIPWTARRSNQSILKEISPGISLEGMMLKLKLQYLGHLMQRVDSLEKTLMLGGIGGRRRTGWQDEMAGWHHWFDGLWVWMKSQSWWCQPTISSSVVPSIFPSIRVFSSESVLPIRRPKYWNFSFNVSPSNEYSGLISFRINWLDLLAVQGTLKRAFSNTTVQKHQFFGAQLSSQSNYHIHTWLLEKP